MGKGNFIFRNKIYSNSSLSPSIAVALTGLTETMCKRPNLSLVSSYYQQYKQLYNENTILNTKMKQVLQQRQEQIKRINEIMLNKIYSKASDYCYRKTRKSRKELILTYHCPFQCNRNYATESSLKQHIKLKHYQQYHQDVLDKFGTMKKMSEKLKISQLID